MALVWYINAMNKISDLRARARVETKRSFDKFSELRGKVCGEMGMDRCPYLDRVFMSVAGERGEFAKRAHAWLAGWDKANIAAPVNFTTTEAPL